MTKSEIEAFLRQPGVLPPDIQGGIALKISPSLRPVI